MLDKLVINKKRLDTLYRDYQDAIKACKEKNVDRFNKAKLHALKQIRVLSINSVEHVNWALIAHRVSRARMKSFKWQLFANDLDLFMTHTGRYNF